MTATAEPSAERVEAPPRGGLDRAEGIELLGPVHGSGYKDGAALVRRADGQIVQLGPLMYALLENLDGTRGPEELGAVLSERLDRHCDEQHVRALAQKLAAQGLLAGTEHKAPPRRNPLLALRWKVLVTNPAVTRRLTAPFAVLFRPWLLWPMLACFVAVCWFVLVDKGVAAATAEAFDSPGLLLLVFVLAVFSAGFHELGHAAACRYGGATPAGMGVGIYMVWPAFYTDVTDAYRLPRRDRLRVDLGGLYFNAVVSVATVAVWLAWRVDALLLLVALQLLQMVKQLSPMIRADGYHILSDATGVPDLFAHIGPTLRRLLPGRRREPSALTGRARLLVTGWVLVIVPVLLSLMIGAVILLPRLLTTAWESGREIVTGIPHQGAIGVLASLVRLLALSLPVLGCALVAQKLVRTVVEKGEAWSEGRPALRAAFVGLAVAGLAGTAWALWPSGQYQAIRASDRGTLGGLGSAIASPTRLARPGVPTVAPGTYLAAALLPVDGATREYPAYLVIPGDDGDPPVAVITASAPRAAEAPTLETSSTTAAPPPSDTAEATAFPFTLPSAPGPGSTQAVAVGAKNHGVTYKVAYAVVTVRDGAPVTNTNSAFAFAHCKKCTTVAVSFQVVLVVGDSKIIAPINAAGALNVDCPACMTTAIADQIVTTLTAAPSETLLQTLEAELQQLDALPSLGAKGTPEAVAAQVAAVQQQIQTTLAGSGLLPNATTTATTTQTTTATTSTVSTSPSATTTSPAPATPETTTGTVTTTGGTETTTAPDG